MSLTKQIIIRVSHELDDQIDQAYSKHLRETGQPCTRAEYIRRMLQVQATLQLSETNALVICAHLNSTADDLDTAGNNRGANILRKMANKFEDLWNFMKENK